MKKPKKETGDKTLMEWLDDRLREDPSLDAKVIQRLNELRLEQELISLREQLNLSQAELARRMGVSQPMVAKLESGRIKNLQLRTLLKATMAMGARLKIEFELRG